MCETCGCGNSELVSVEVHENLLANNDRIAQHNREHFGAHATLALNLMGSPGCGKTALLEATARRWEKEQALCAVSGDLATDNDAQRLQRAGIVSKSITTGTACHLDAEMLHNALHTLNWKASDIFFIENVGNLVCPAIFDLGQAANVVAVSVTEGEDKPLKYPVMFQRADLVLLTKTDLLPHLDGFDVSAFERAVASVCPDPRIFRLSARTGEGMEAWLTWLRERIEHLQAQPPQHTHHHHHHHAPK